MTFEGQWEQLVDDYFRHRRRRGMAPNTEKVYTMVLRDFQRFAGHRIDRLSAIDRQLIEAWQDCQVGRWSPSTRSGAAVALRRLLEWAETQERPIPAGLARAVEAIKVRKGLPRPLSGRDLDRLLAYLQPFRPTMSVRDRRDRALIFFLLGTAARISEALQVRRDEFESTVVIQKGGWERQLMAPPVVVAAIVDYLKARRDDLPWLWVGFTREGPTGRLTAEGIRHICNRLSVKVGIPHFTPHQLRHSAATELLDAGIQESAIASHLGHHGLGSLSNYTEVRPAKRAEALMALNAALSRARNGSTS